MASESKIGAAFVELAVKGFKAVQEAFKNIKTNLANMKGAKVAVSAEGAGAAKKVIDDVGKAASDTFKKMEAGLKQIGSIAQRTFFGAAASITGFIRMADPAGFARFEGTLAAISVQIGSIFLPLLDAVQRVLEKVLGWFRNLSNEQKENILHWVKIGLAIAGILAILPKLIGLINMLSAAMTFFGVESALATGGITVLLGALAAAIPLLISLFGSMQGGEGMGGVFAPIAESLQRLWDVVKEIFSRIGQFISSVMQQLAPLFEQVVGVWIQIFRGLFDAISGILQALMPVVEGIVGAIVQGIQGILPIVMQAAQVIGQIFQQLAPIVARVFAVIGGIIQRIVPIFFRIYQTVERIFVRILQAVNQILGPALELISTIIDTVSSALFPLLETIGDVVSAVMEAFEPLITQIIDALVPVITEMINIVQEIVEALQPLIEVVMQIVEVIASALAPVFEALANIVSTVVSVVGSVFRALMAAIRPVVDVLMAVLRPVLEAIAAVIRWVVNAIVRCINAFIDAINGFIDWYNDQSWLPGHLNRLNRLSEMGERAERRREDETRRTRAETRRERRAREPGRHAGEANQKVELMGLPEAWRKAQQSAGTPTPEERRLQEILETNRRQAGYQRELVENTRPRDTPPPRWN